MSEHELSPMAGKIVEYLRRMADIASWPSDQTERREWADWLTDADWLLRLAWDFGVFESAESLYRCDADIEPAAKRAADTLQQADADLARLMGEGE